jgi:Bax protein
VTPEILLYPYRAWFLVAAGVLALGTLGAYLLAPSHPGAANVPRFTQQDVAERKKAFFDFVGPIARHHNEHIAAERAELLTLAGKESLNRFDERRLQGLALRYSVDMAAVGRDEAIELLKRRIDIVPVSLVLVQAAKESGWGESRFAQEGNALFGEWCFTAGCGMVPNARAEDRTHEVTAFDNAHDAVGSYMRNLNTHDSYVEFRIARARLRENGEALSGMNLAEYLVQYSERREDYVLEVQNMILQNNLETD